MPASLQINIASPCHENYQHMTPNEHGRFCGSCQKTVVDFSTMTDQEILGYIAKASGGICGRLAPDQMNKTLQGPPSKRRKTLMYFWNLLLAAFLISKANAQVKPVKSNKHTVTKMPARMTMGEIAIVEPEPIKTVLPITAKGIVIDSSNNEPIGGASIRIDGSSHGTVADSLGHFSIPIDRPEKMQVAFSAIGYETEMRTIDKNTDWQHLDVYLKPLALELDSVVVTGFPNTECVTYAGGIGMVLKVDTIEKIQRVISDLTPAVLKKNASIKVFPNPVVRGNNIQLDLALKQPGEYKLELLNTAGQIMQMQVIQMPEKEKLITVPTEAGWSAGVYWVRITGQHIKNVYTGKVLIK